ncbi:MAG: hypothetical protein WDN06_04900 [Asticcacaulis sp.]
MESSGSVERLGYSLLWQAGMPCVLINPRLVYHYGQSLGFLEKTDRLDARSLPLRRCQGLGGSASAKPCPSNA